MVKFARTGHVKHAIRRITDYWLNDASFVVLMLMLVFTVFILPILIDYGHVNMLFVNVVFMFLFFTGIWSSDNKGLIALTTILFLAQLVLRILRFSDLPVEFYLWERLVGLANMLVFIFLNIRLLFRNYEVGLYRIIGAINVYLLVAILGAFAMEIIQITIGSSISGLSEQAPVHQLKGVDQDFSTYIYFSLVSLTTVGFGDYTPVNILSKMLSVMLSTTGILYPAVVIAKLVGSSNEEKQ
ncbi:two pore domain potassium channel family protein [Algoriphagus sp. H41]|uniref:Two pore domain potassium channel family protein n=1 Tax=Algoriphagus oliviformis TaxID=2811231 RepID=A0ABS3C549_9BACT|nr:potassium channel family protein [Algoriphagus oliviformis]MBN7810714.1 two pore domain potassium channel family protein [Algoriphagus oliviformis]